MRYGMAKIWRGIFTSSFEIEHSLPAGRQGTPNDELRSKKLYHSMKVQKQTHAHSYASMPAPDGEL